MLFNDEDIVPLGLKVVHFVSNYNGENALNGHFVKDHFYLSPVKHRKISLILRSASEFEVQLIKFHVKQNFSTFRTNNSTFSLFKPDLTGYVVV